MRHQFSHCWSQACLSRQWSACHAESAQSEEPRRAWLLEHTQDRLGRQNSSLGQHLLHYCLDLSFKTALSSLVTRKMISSGFPPKKFKIKTWSQIFSSEFGLTAVYQHELSCHEIFSVLKQALPLSLTLSSVLYLLLPVVIKKHSTIL